MKNKVSKKKYTVILRNTSTSVTQPGRKMVYLMLNLDNGVEREMRKAE